MSDDKTVNDQQSNEPDEQTPEKSSIKGDLREGAAKVVALAVEVGSLLSGESGELVSAEREVAEAEVEEFIDKIDGEG